ncbi:E3 ubiquitin-protein ligase UPL3 [Acorus gramineus]|uniref:HECT-type E3 ubiquitin transferase n=1 Tax=Acorus gramineus TaxID=55184 RepID=A0AAV9ADN1_ACOGR|nr:E3 ubiquitin-protein ligase UPL3 [Acorus gramineus]
METRSRKRVEAASSSSAPSSRPSKRSRTTTTTSSSSAAAPVLASAPPAPTSTIVTRSRKSNPMDSSSTPSTEPSSSRGRRKSNNNNPPEPEINKGKEKEPAVPVVEGDDEVDGASGFGLFHNNMTSASSALQGLLRKLGAGFDDLIPSSGGGSLSVQQGQMGGRLKKILAMLREGEEGRQIEGLTQLCEILSIGTEDSLGGFAVDAFVPILVGMVGREGGNPDVMLLAARAITHLCDVLPSSCVAVVHYGAVPSFCARLLTIEYMDLAEQSLQALKKISQEHPTACLRAGALMAVLSYLDFFSTGVQRVALSTAANMCKKLQSDAADFVMDAVPLLTNLLHYHDSKGLIRLLSTCASGSPLSAKTLLLLGISGILKDILSGSGLVSNISVSPALSRPSEQIFEIVNLADELLPPLPQGTISLPISLNTLAKGSAVKKTSTSTDRKMEANGLLHEISAREKLLCDQPELLQQFGMDLLPVLIQVYGSSVNGAVRHKCLSVIGKLMYFSTAEMIQSLLSITNISSFLAGVLAWRDPQVLIPTLQITEILMEKLPETFSKMFAREGVVHAIESLISADTISAQTSTAKDNDVLPGKRSQRYARRTGSLNVDGSSMEESKSSNQGNIGSPLTSIEGPAVNYNLRAAVSACAKAVRDKYFSVDSGSTEVGVTDDLLHLKNLCSKLNSISEDQRTKMKGKSKASGHRVFEILAGNEEHLNGVICEMLSELSKGDGVSTFEFIGSGVVAALLNYFSCGTFAKEKVTEVNLPKLRQLALRRYKSFIAAALPYDSDGAPMDVLVQKLQNALSSLERFPVVLSHSFRSTNGSARLSSGLSALSRPLKLRLCRAHGDKSLRDYSSNIVLIDPLASLAAVEEFLWPRVQRTESGQKSSASAGSSEPGTTPTAGTVSSPSTTTPASSGRRHSTRSMSSVTMGGTTRKDSNEGHPNSSKGKGKAVLKSTPDETRAPQTRNAARRKAALDKDVEMKPFHSDSTSEDEELDISPVEIDNDLVIEEDDISDEEDDDHEVVLRDDPLPVCIPDKVHDVKLGDATDDGSTVSAASDSHTHPSGSINKTFSNKGVESEFRSGNSSGSRVPMSFSAAAMAGLMSRGIRGSRDRHGLSMFGSSMDPPKLLFLSGGKQLNRNLSIYQAIQHQLVCDENDEERYSSPDLPSSDGRLATDIYTITYQKADNQAERVSPGGLTSTTVQKYRKGGSASNSSSDSSWKQTSLLDSILQGELPCDLEKSNPTYNILAILRVLEGLNQLAPRLRIQALSDDFAVGKISSLGDLSTSGMRVSSESFINSKLTPKLARQIQDALALCSGSLPSWCYQLTRACPFLFPFETRRQYFYSTAFGLSRALHRLQQQQGADGQSSTNEREVRVGRLQRQKVRVSRTRILDSAAKVMEMYSSQKAVLEVEYFGEVGTGLGPTLEFYTLLSHDLQKVGLGMWRSNSVPGTSAIETEGDVQKCFNTEDNSEVRKVESDTAVGLRDLVQAPLGLFPRPWSSNADASEGSPLFKVIEYFRLLGRVMAKALQDGRLLDLPLSMAFYKLVLGQELDIHDIALFDAEFGKILQELQLLVCRKKHLESLPGNNQKAISELHFHGAPIDDLCLDFTVPGYPEYILKPGGEGLLVDINNLEDYISLVVDATVKMGIMRQMEAFRAGFNQRKEREWATQVLEITSLQIFSPHELDYLLCGRRELWKADALADHIKFDHGYTAKSPAIVNHSSTAANTASNASGASETADDDLPSVMTCANYLKLPPYSTKEIMYKKLLYAINEGQGSFDLS